MRTLSFGDDTLESLGAVTGVFLVLVGLGTVIGMPWQTNAGLLVSIIQLLGVVGTVAAGAGIVWLTQQE